MMAVDRIAGPGMEREQNACRFNYECNMRSGWLGYAND